MYKQLANYIAVYIDLQGEEQVMEIPAYSESQAMFLVEQDTAGCQIVSMEYAGLAY